MFMERTGDDHEKEGRRTASQKKKGKIRQE